MCFDDPVTQCGHSNWTNKCCFTVLHAWFQSENMSHNHVMMGCSHMFCFYICKLVSTSDYDAAVASSPQFGALYLVFFPNQICFRAYYLPLIHLSTNQKIQQIRSQPIRRNGTFNVIFTLAYLFKSIPLFSIPCCILCIDDREPRTLACLL